MSVLNSEETELFNVAKKSLPKLLFSEDDNVQEIFAGFAKLFRLARNQIQDWVDQTYILGAVSYFLDQHAKDRGTRRRSGEGDPELQTRLRNIEDLVTEPALLARINVILAANGLPETGAIVELRQDRAFFLTNDATIKCIAANLLIDGETFTIDDGVLPRTYEFDNNASITPGNFAVDISTAVTAQDVAAEILAVLGGSVTFQINPLVDDEVKIRSSIGGQVLFTGETVTNAGFIVTDGRKDAYFQRGYRMGRRVNEIIVILPFGTTTAIAEAIREDVRQRKGGGIVVYVEVRANP